MTNEDQMKQAATAYQTLCELMDQEGWHYEQDAANFRIHCGVQGEDLPMPIRIDVDPERLLVILISEIPFTVPENRRDAIAVAVSAANYGLADGNFDFDYAGGTLLFRMTTSYRDSLIGKSMFGYMIMFSSAIIDEYNDKFLMVAKSEMSNEDIMKFIG